MGKRIAALSALILLGLSLHANDKSDIVKTGLNFGPLPMIKWDTDKGLQLDAVLNIYNFGDGKAYPNPYNSWYLEFAKYPETWMTVVSYDNKTLIPKTRFCAAMLYCADRTFDFFGYNGYQSNYDYTLGNVYKINRDFLVLKADFVGTILPHLQWEAGYHFTWIDIDRKKECVDGGVRDLYTMYCDWGLIPESQKNGGISSELRAGICYDTRDVENMPSRGIWAEGHFIAAPTWLGSSVGFSRFCLTWRQYLPVFTDKLVFAYRLAYQGFLGDAPWYMLPYYTVMGPMFDRDAVGSFNTVRGLKLNRVQGLQTAFFNAELRWNFINFPLWNQNIGFALSGYFDGGQVVKPFPTDFNPAAGTDATALKHEYDTYLDPSTPDVMHLSTGGGLRFILNRNFMIAFELAHALNATDARFGNTLQDNSKNSFYIKTGYTF